jgi:hypothetical protein
MQTCQVYLLTHSRVLLALSAGALFGIFQFAESNIDLHSGAIQRYTEVDIATASAT